MMNQKKYNEIRKMSPKDREEIHQFAIQRSREMLSGLEEQPICSLKTMDAASLVKRTVKSK